MKDVNIRDLGGDEKAAKMQHMENYNFDGMKVCNSHVALNSHYFCVGLVGEFKAESETRKNDKRSILGIFEYKNGSDRTSASWTTSIVHWIN